MTLVRRSSPLGELVSLRQAMDRLFEDSSVRPRSWAMVGFDGHSFPVDVTNGSDSIMVEASMPGFKPEDVEITVENGLLSIKPRRAWSAGRARARPSSGKSGVDA